MQKKGSVKDDDPKWGWMWAYREQLRLLDGFDSRGLYCGETQLDDISWHYFRNEYALRQGHHAEFKDRRNDIIDVIEPLFRPALSNIDATKELSHR